MAWPLRKDDTHESRSVKRIGPRLEIAWRNRGFYGNVTEEKEKECIEELCPMVNPVSPRGITWGASAAEHESRRIGCLAQRASR